MAHASFDAGGEIRRWARPSVGRAILLVLGFCLLVGLSSNFLSFSRVTSSMGNREYLLPTLFMLLWLTIMFGVIISALSWVERVRVEGAWVAVTHGPFGIGKPKRFPIEGISGVRLTELPYAKRAQSEGSYAIFGHRRALAFDCDGATCYAFSGLRSGEGEDVLIRFRSLSGVTSMGPASVEGLRTPHVTVSSSADGVVFDLRFKVPLAQRIQLWGMTLLTSFFTYAQYRRGEGIALVVAYLLLAVLTGLSVSALTFGTRRLRFERERVTSRFVLGGVELLAARVVNVADLSGVEYITGEKKLKWNGGVKDAPGVHLKSARADIGVGQSFDEAERKALYELIRTRSGLPAALFTGLGAAAEGAPLA